MVTPDFELVTFANGSMSMKDLALGEAMHSLIGPAAEATLLYVEQSQLADRLQSKETAPLVIHDVGLGIAANALGALDCRQNTAAGARPLHIWSFETKPQGLALALQNAEQFPFLVPHQPKLKALLEHGFWQSGDRQIQWRLIPNSYLETIEQAPPPELIYWDFYSPRVCPELWTRQAFERVIGACIPRHRQGLATTLYTYSSATAPRAALLLAGFFVGYGRATSAKTDTTIASTVASEISRPLDARWLARAENSTKLGRETYLEVRRLFEALPK